MTEYNTCVRCGGTEVDKLMINTRISLNYPEKKERYSGTISQKVIFPTDAIVCKDCGHVEFFVDWNKFNK